MRVRLARSRERRGLCLIIMKLERVRADSKLTWMNKYLERKYSDEELVGFLTLNINSPLIEVQDRNNLRSQRAYNMLLSFSEGL